MAMNQNAISISSLMRTVTNFTGLRTPTTKDRLSYEERTRDAIFGRKVANDQQTQTVGGGMGLFLSVSNCVT